MLTRLIKMPKIAAKSGELIDTTTSPVEKMTLITLRQFTAHSLPRAFFSLILGLEDENRHNRFLNDAFRGKKTLFSS